MASPEPTFLIDTPNNTLVTYRHLVMHTGWAPPTVEVARRADLAAREIGRQTGGNAIYVEHAIGAGVPPAEVREAYLRVAQRGTDHIRCIAIIVAAEGFAGSAVRAVVTGLIMALPTRRPIKVFQTPGDAATWIARNFEGVKGFDAIRPDEFLEVIRAVEERHRATTRRG